MNTWFHGAAIMRAISETLEAPTHMALLACACAALIDCGVYLYERWGSKRAWRNRPTPSIMKLARARVGRADIVARVGPMLGLMGTLIPLGPGLSALGHGDMATLASAVTVAFDTTVVGLVIGMVGFALGRARRQFYDSLLDTIEIETAPGAHDA